MKERLYSLMMVAVVLATALGYYFGHDFVNRLILNAPKSLMHLAGN